MAKSCGATQPGTDRFSYPLSKLEDDLKKATMEDDRKPLRDELARSERERTRLMALLVTLELAGPLR